MANILSKSFITGLFVKQQKPKTRRAYTGGKKWTEEQRMLLVAMIRLGASNKTISETFKELRLVRSEKAIEVAKSRFQTELKAGKTYYFKIEM